MKKSWTKTSRYIVIISPYIDFDCLGVPIKLSNLFIKFQWLCEQQQPITVIIKYVLKKRIKTHIKINRVK